MVGAGCYWGDKHHSVPVHHQALTAGECTPAAQTPLVRQWISYHLAKGTKRNNQVEKGWRAS